MDELSQEQGVSLKQLAANRQNAKLGGVKTPEGKAVSRYNALKHGILSQEVLLEDENGADLTVLGRKLRAELAPDTELELVLVDRITANVWRLRRVLQIEREMMEDDISDGGFLLTGAKKTLGSALGYDFTHCDTYGKLIRYEASIERGIYKALHELQRLQAVRNGERIAPPVTVDVDVSGDQGGGFVS